MSGYTKLFNSILASTVWRAPDHTRIVWITMLAMADRNGVVESSMPGLADFARVPLDACQAALRALSEPDEWSRSQEHDGRRIEAVDGGWRLLNHSKYREKLGADERREYLKLKQREYRKRKRVSTVVTEVSDTATMSDKNILGRHIASPEAEASPDTEASTPTIRVQPKIQREEHASRATMAGMAPIFQRNPHLKHSACDPELAYCVPTAVHEKLADRLAPRYGGDREKAKESLQTWYRGIWGKLVTGFVMGDAFKFWQAQFDAHFANEAVAEKPKPTKAEIEAMDRAAAIRVGAIRG